MDYVSALTNLCAYYQGREIKYIPHRDEHIIPSGSVVLEEMEVLSLEVPIEQYFLSNNIFPSCVVGFFSTALFSLHFIFNNNAHCYFFRIPSEQLLDNGRCLLDAREYFIENDIEELKVA